MHRRLLTICLLLLLPCIAQAGLFDRPADSARLGTLDNRQDFLPVDDAFRLQQLATGDHQLLARFEIADGYYLYRHSLKLISSIPDLQPSMAIPEGKHKSDDYFGEVQVYYQQLDLPIELPDPLPEGLELQIQYQGCAERGLCYPPQTRALSLSEIGASARQPSPGPSVSTAPSSQDWTLQSLALFYLAGLGLAFTPCVLPMLPILSGIVLRNAQSTQRSLLLALAYVLPMALSLAILGALMGSFGAGLNLQARLQSPWILIPFAALFVAFALSMFGLYELRLPERLSRPLDRMAGHARGGSLSGAAVLGILSTLLVSPCVSAPLAAALVYISSSGDVLGGGLQLLGLGLGMGTPLLILALGGQRLLPKSGAWMVGVRNLFGVLLLGMAIWLLSRILPAPLSLALWATLAIGTALAAGTLEPGPRSIPQRLLQAAGLLLLIYGAMAWIGALQGQGNPLQPLARQHGSTPMQLADSEIAWQRIDSRAELEALMQQARDRQQPLILDWYADWCISCQVIETEVFDNPQVQGQLRPYARVRLDLTENRPEHLALLDQYRLFGPPAILFFDDQGKERQSSRIVGEIDADEFLGHLAVLD